MRNYTTQDLLDWDKRIEEKALEYGLKCFPIEFMLVDHDDMMNYMAYGGMPSSYPHWSFGKQYERSKTMYDHGVTGLPYEMVINSNPAIAYLHKDNTKLLQILTMAHVYAHVHFFTNNFNFKYTQPEYTVEMFKNHANRIRSYIKDPSIGDDEMELVLDSARAVAWNCRRNLAIRKVKDEEQQERAIDASIPPEDPFKSIHRRPEYKEPELHKIPLEPEEDLLLFIRDYNPFLSEWEQDVLTIVDEETKYFIPMMDTKIMNEGFASYWHHKILNNIGLDDALQMEFAINHSHVVTPHPGHINPYYIGFTMLHDIAKRFGEKRVFETVESDRDSSFIRQYLTKELAREMHLIEFEPDDDKYVVTKVSDDDNWDKIRDSLVKNIGMNSMPVIKVTDSGFGHSQTLELTHEHDGRDLYLEYLDMTLHYVNLLWRRPVILKTKIDGRNIVATCRSPKEVVEYQKL